MRLLLNVKVGCTSYADIQIVDGCVFDTFHEACGALGLFADDRELIDVIKEVYVLLLVILFVRFFQIC